MLSDFPHAIIQVMHVFDSYSLKNFDYVLNRIIDTIFMIFQQKKSSKLFLGKQKLVETIKYKNFLMKIFSNHKNSVTKSEKENSSGVKALNNDCQWVTNPYPIKSSKVRLG